jgi:tetratricopeptide (TPR) repeat protein
MEMPTREQNIKAMVAEANQLSKEGENAKAMDLLIEANRMVVDEYHPHKDSLMGLVCHYKGRLFQSIGAYKEAVEDLERAIEFRKNDLVAKAYSAFQLFICKIYGKLSITDQEVKETKMALGMALADDAASIADIGNFLQNIAYIEQVEGSVEKAVAFYKAALVMREEAEDARGYALTQARLAECYKTLGKDTDAKRHGESALEYFTKTHDTERIKQVESVLMFSVIFTGMCLIGSWLKFAQHG